jgi:NADH dehydrogenase
VGAAQKLGHADADVVLVDKHDYHTFQPLLYQLATGLLDTSAVGHALRDLIHDQENTSFHQATVTGIDLEAREVRFENMQPLTYDYLVLGLGAEVNFFGTEGAAEHTFPMYTLLDAVRLKEHVLERWEAADTDPGLVEDGALNVVVVGGGPTGVETAGAMAELYRNVFSKDYRNLPQSGARVILVEAEPEIFAMFKPDIRAYTVEALEKRTVEVMTGERVASVSPTRVRLESGATLRAHTLVWGAGLQGNRLVQSLGLDLERGDRIGVGPELDVLGHPEVYVVGDAGAITDAKTNQVLPQLGSVALQSGKHVGETIAKRLAGEKTKPFKYRDKGTMATIGPGAAVVQMLGGRTRKGKAAQLAWGTVHLALLPTNADRAKAIVDWAGAGLTHQRSGRIIVRANE